jgi:hypothetical protein
MVSMGRVTARRKKQIPIKTKSSPKKIETRALVLVDQEKIRKDYIKKCKRTMKDLEKAKKEILEYENTDLPSYHKWYNQTFGNKLSLIRETHEKAGELFHTLKEIEYFKNKKKISYYEAYLLVQDKKKNPDKYKEEEEASHEYYQYSDEDDWNDEDYGVFDDEDFAHDNPDSTPEMEAEIEEAFAEFLRSNPEAARDAKHPKMRKVLFEFFRSYYYDTKEQREGSFTPSQAKENMESRIKARYRQLVRRLHPDYCKERTEHLDNLWHEVQIAYQAKDLERLDMLLAISSINEGDFNADFSVSQILDVQKEYKDQLKAIRSKIRKAKKEPSWGFTKLKSTAQIGKVIDRQLTANYHEEKRNLEHFQLILQEWSKPPVPRNSHRNRHSAIEHLFLFD